MPKYCIGGTSPNGRREIVLIEAGNPGDAVRFHRSRGFQDVVYYVEWTEKGFSAKEHVRLMTASPLGFSLYNIRKMLLGYAGVFLGLLFMMPLLGVVANRFRMIDAAIPVGALLMICSFAFYGGFFSPVLSVKRISYLMTWNRWQESLDLLPKIRRSVTPFDYASYQAVSWAGMGKIEESLRILRPFLNDPETPSWMYEQTICFVYLAVNRPDDAIDHIQKACELMPEQYNLKLILARLIVRYRNSPEEAQAILEEIDRDGLREPQIGEYLFVQGVIEQFRRNVDLSIEFFEESQKILRRYAPSFPESQALWELSHARSCLSYANKGNKEEAIRHFKIAEARLQLPQNQELLADCRRAIGA